MENPDQRAAVNKLVNILRKVTRYFQFVPFVYLFIYSVLILSETFISDGFADFINSILLITPVWTVGTLIIAKLLELCVWHKTACLLPVTSEAFNFIDGTLFQFTEFEIILINSCIGIVSISFIILSYLHFFTDGRKNARKSHA